MSSDHISNIIIIVYEYSQKSKLYDLFKKSHIDQNQTKT